MKIRKGTIVAITTGEYSDYGLRDHMRALKDFDSDEEKSRFRDSGDYLAAPEWDKDGEKETYGSDDRFIAWCIREELMSPMSADEVVELWIGRYGRLE